jgi:3-hydroxy acid dehydrogenase / malonic semialdehyde reductase
MEIVLITGATSGIGEASATILASKGYKLILCGRRKERLEMLEKKLGAITSVYTLTFDVRNYTEVENMISNLPEEWKNIDILINNAGNAHGFSPIDKGDIADWDAMIDINVKGLLYVSKVVMPIMVERKKGHIINIGSIAGLEVYPDGNIYCASKHAVDAVTKSMRLDLLQHGIKVSGINPGMVETEFALVRFKGDEDKAKSVYKGMQPLRADDIADIVYFIISRPAHVNIADLLVFPSAQSSATRVRRNGEGD